MGKNHSWCIVHWHLAREFKKLGHTVDLFSTDGIENMPQDLRSNVIGYKKWEDKSTNKNASPIVGHVPNFGYDMCFSYTAMKNFRYYLGYSDKNKLGCWCYEWVGKNILPNDFATCYKFSDLVLTPSTYAKEGMMMSSGIPEDRVVVVPHGVEVESFRNAKPVDFPTKKKFKFVFNVTQAHLRKNIRGLLNAYGKAFNSTDDVCLILKTKDRKPRAPFEVSVNDEIKRFKKNFNNPPEVKVYSEFLENIAELYAGADCVVSLAHGEGFNIPLLESIAAGKLVVAPTLGAHRDFINNDNALLVKSELVKADRKSMYWGPHPNAKWVLSDTDDAATKLREAYETASERNKMLEKNREQVYKQYDWSVVAKQVIDLCD